MTTSSQFWLRSQPSKHTNLYSQQRHLRHLTCIIGRNIDPNLVQNTRSAKSSLLMLYFTIHNANDLSIVLYKSEVIENTLNPNWKEFDPETFHNHELVNTESSMTVFLWGARKQGNFKVILQYDVHLSGLVYVQDQLRKHEQQYESNSLFFQMFGGYYAAPSALTKQKYEERKITESIKVPVCNVKNSYKQTSLMRLHGVIKAIQQTRKQVQTVQTQMNSLLSAHRLNTEKRAKMEYLLFKNKLLREEFERLKECHEEEKRGRDRQSDILHNRERELEERIDELEQYVCEMKINHSAHVKKKETLIHCTGRLIHRRRQLAAELSYIFPIIQLPTSVDSKHEFGICGTRLPNSEDFVGEDDTMLSVSLGYAAQLVYMMAKFLELPLRYPICPMGSRSSVFDVVTDKLTDREREFPLYRKGKEKFQFHYGVFLLNKNIAQLRYHNEIGTPDLRNTLENLKTLLEDKFGVRIVMKTGTTGNIMSSLQRLRSTTTKPYTNRKPSTPLTSSSPLIEPSFSSHRENDDTLPLTNGNRNDIDIDRPFLPRSSRLSSSSLSGLPAVALKGNQHPYITKKASQRRSMNNSRTISQSISPDLITTTCEEIVRLGNQPTNQQVSSNTISLDSNISIIDCAEECIDEHHENDAGNHNNLRALERTYSDALIIPDPFEREPDDLMSPDPNLNNVNNLIV